MDYKVKESGRLENGAVRYDIDNIVTGDNNDIDRWLRENLKPGDTVQWIYPQSQTEHYTYEEILVEWQKWDDYKSGTWDGMSEWAAAEPDYEP